MSQAPIDQATPIRPGEEPDSHALDAYLRAHVPDFGGIVALQQFPGGYSNLTYLIETPHGEYVLRRPPFGANIQSAHDMAREFKVLSLLRGVYDKIPEPVHYCESTTVIGAPFYLMRRVKGIILRASRPPLPEITTPEAMKALSMATIDNLVALHGLELEASGLMQLGKPAGYVQRQVEGWIGRYFKAETDQIPGMNEMAAWMSGHMPPDGAPALIHNDYKYDNLIIDPANWGHVIAVLDWEMATIGDPLMDLGTTLAYWTEAHESPALRMFNLTSLPGNLSRMEALERYALRSGRDTSSMLFYFVFASFKLGVIIQQIYARYKKGMTQDPRFAGLIEVVKACADHGTRALDRDRICDLY